MPSDQQKRGNVGEYRARRFLQKLGYRFVDQHWNCRYGELDLIMLDGEELVFVEVKLRHSNTFGHPEEMVDFRKKARLLKTAERYLNSHQELDCFWRFDIVAITTGEVDKQIRHFRDVIRED